MRKALLSITQNSEAIKEKTEISEYRKTMKTSTKQYQLFKRQATDYEKQTLVTFLPE